MGKSAMGSLSFIVAANALLILDDDDDDDDDDDGEKMGGDKKAAADAMPAPPNMTFRRWSSFILSSSLALPVDCSDVDRRSCLAMLPAHLTRY